MSKKRLKQPVECPGPVYDVMSACWEHNPASRPTAAELSARMAGLEAADKHVEGRPMLVLADEDGAGVHVSE